MFKELARDSVNLIVMVALHVLVHPLPLWIWAIFGVVMTFNVGLSVLHAWHRRLEVSAG